MKINWIVRIRNKVWLASFVTFVVSTVYDLLSMFDVVPAISQDSVMSIVDTVIRLLSLVGMIADPTTPGLQDSDRAMSYIYPGVPKE